MAAETEEEDGGALDALESLELTLEHNSSEALLNMDAIEVCGSPAKKDLDNFDAPCKSGEGGDLRIITAACGQGDGPYKLPKNRLYVCNPNSKLRGAIFKEGEKPKAIQSEDELESTMRTLASGNLFKWQTSYPGGQGKRRNGRKVKGKPHRFYLWVLDMDGNWITGPESQGGYLLKHGDFTPGQYPWMRPKKGSLLEASEEALAEGESADQGSEETDEEMEESQEELQVLAEEMEAEWGRAKVQKEKRMGGNFRGLARAGGEIRFHPEHGASANYALIEDSSGYASFRVVAKGLDPHRKMSDEEAKSHVKKAKKHSTLGACAMKRIKDYLQGPVGVSLSGIKVAAVYFDPGRRYQHV